MNDSRNKSFFVVYLIVAHLLSAVTAMAQPSRKLPSAAQSQYAFRHITTEDGLQNNEVKGLLFDKHGLLWIETQTGWDIYDGKQVKAVEGGTPLPGNARPSAKAIRRGVRLPLPSVSSSCVANAILDVKDDGKGNLWVATDHQGVYIYDKANRQFTNLLHSPSQSTSIAENHVSCIAISKDGTVALGHIKKGISIYTPAPFRLTHFQSATWRNVSSVVEDRSGNLWIGTDGYGLFDVTRRKRVETEGNIVVSLLEDRQGRIWIGTYKEGLICLQGGKVARRYTKADGLLDDNISRHSIILLHDGNMVIGSYEGFSFVNLTGKRHPLESMLPYEIGEEWTVWTSWQALLIYALLLTSILVTYFLMRRTKRKAIAVAIKKAEEVWTKDAPGGQRTYVDITPGETKITSVDEQLVEKAVKVVEENIANDFTVEDLSKAVGLTRGHLHKRLTAITGKTPGEFIRTIRMKRACRLLDESGMSVSEVAYAASTMWASKR